VGDAIAMTWFLVMPGGLWRFLLSGFAAQRLRDALRSRLRRLALRDGAYVKR
jgi:hypothetical protein